MSEDRIQIYLKDRLGAFVFGELSEDYLSRAEELDFLTGVPLPWTAQDLKAFGKKEGLSLLILSDNMAQVLGCDPKFPYKEPYLRLLHRAFEGKEGEAFLAAGNGEADKGDLMKALVYLRCSLLAEPKDHRAWLSYGLVCRDLYNNSDDRDYVGRFKAQSIEALEQASCLKEDYAPALYHLGFAYLNMGLYTKAFLTWKQFLLYCDNEEQQEEIEEQQNKLKDPMAIEAGCNHVSSGRWEEGRKMLRPYRNSKYKDWWPLHYYLGIAALGLDAMDEAEECFKQVLTLNPSHLESLAELEELCLLKGDEEGAEKYRRKTEIIAAQLSKAGGGKEGDQQ